ncbi:MAG: hypothetical protein GF308_04435 [Candidatus Heimdallarchaeota archaeon]|nr:hypothetical protein [Candidatus Heimdallarchaeota archaeon]
MKRVKDDLGSIIDAEDNLPRMLLIEEAIDAALEIREEVAKSYALSDIITTITDLARETNNENALNRIEHLLEDITNLGAKVRAICYYSVALADFGYKEKAEQMLIKALNLSVRIKDDFDQRDAFLEVATAAADLAFLLGRRDLIKLAKGLAEQLTKEQIVYLKGYLAQTVPAEEGLALFREAITTGESIENPISRSKAFLDLANLLASFDLEETNDD